MSYLKYLIVIVLTMLMVFGCAKKKEEAAKLEQEMLEQEEQIADTTVDATAVPTEQVVDETPDADVSAVPEEESIQISTQSEGDGFSVQVAACPSIDYARWLVKKYINRGYEPYITTAVVNGDTYYRVRIGGFETREKAETLKNELIDRYSIKPWIN